MRVAFLAPNIGSPGSFYDVFCDCLRVAADQLGVHLEVVAGSKERDLMVARGREVLEGPEPPDYLLLVNYRSVGDELLPLAAAAGVGTFFVVEGIEHRGLSEGYLGQIVPDDVETGRMLTEILASHARQLGLADGNGKVQVGVVAGETSQAGKDRFRGFLDAKRGHDDVEQATFAYGSWEEEGGAAAVALMLQNAPATSVIWCANDAMALGALAAATEAGRRPGQDLLIGGVDLTDRALVEVEKGTLAVSIGGHLIDGVRALVWLHDHHGSRVLEPVRSVTHLVAVEAPEARRYREFIQGRGWGRVDFKRFSRRHRPSADDLSLDAILNG